MSKDPSWHLDKATTETRYLIVDNLYEEGNVLGGVRLCSAHDRLDAIRDAPRCEHDSLSRHIIEGTISQTPNHTGYDRINFDYCDGSPELAALLKALGECRDV